jgi:hypothetical protein
MVDWLIGNAVESSEPAAEAWAVVINARVVVDSLSQQTQQSNALVLMPRPTENF